MVCCFQPPQKHQYFMLAGKDSQRDPFTDNVEFATSIMHRHVSSFPNIIPVRKQLTHELIQLEAPLLEYAGFSVLREDNILRCQGRGRPNGYTFLTG